MNIPENMGLIWAQ